MNGWSILFILLVAFCAFAIGGVSGRNTENGVCQRKIDAMSQAYGAYSGSNGF